MKAVMAIYSSFYIQRNLIKRNIKKIIITNRKTLSKNSSVRNTYCITIRAILFGAIEGRKILLK